MASHDPHPETEALSSLSALELAERLRDGRITSTDVVTGLLARIAAVDAPSSPTALRSILAVSADALDQAAAADARRQAGVLLSPLDGIPIVVKDNIEVSGLPSTAGSTSLLDSPHGDADLVTTLREAGLIILGSTNLSEWANLRSPNSASGWSAVGGLTANPWATDRSAGGSSSGSGAALAAGLSPLAIGTETDGSIVCPSSLNGVVGLKPTVGAISTRGVVPLSASQDSPGPMARTVADLTALFHVLLGIGDLFPEEELPLCAGVATTWKTGHLPTDTLFEGAISVLRKAGLNLIDVQVSLPSEQDQHDELAVLLCEMHDDLSQYLGGRAHAPANLSEVVAFEEAHAEVELAHFGHEFFEQSLATGGRAAADYHAARERNLSWATTCLNDALHGVDLLLAPTYGPAWKQDLVIGEGGAKAAPTTMAPAIAGWPIACVPMGLASGLPVGLGLIGRPGSEAKLLHFAALVERHLDLTGQGQFRPTFAAPRRG